MKGRLLLDVVVRQGTVIQTGGELLIIFWTQEDDTFTFDVVVRQSSVVLQHRGFEDQCLLVWWNLLLVLDSGLDACDVIACIDI